MTFQIQKSPWDLVSIWKRQRARQFRKSYVAVLLHDKAVCHWDNFVKVFFVFLVGKNFYITHIRFATISVTSCDIPESRMNRLTSHRSIRTCTRICIRSIEIK